MHLPSPQPSPKMGEGARDYVYCSCTPKEGLGDEGKCNISAILSRLKLLSKITNAFQYYSLTALEYFIKITTMNIVKFFVIEFVTGYVTCLHFVTCNGVFIAHYLVACNLVTHDFISSYIALVNIDVLGLTARCFTI